MFGQNPIRENETGADGLVPIASLDDGINAVRRTLPLCVFHPRTEETGIADLIRRLAGHGCAGSTNGSSSATTRFTSAASTSVTSPEGIWRWREGSPFATRRYSAPAHCAMFW